MFEPVTFSHGVPLTKYPFTTHSLSIQSPMGASQSFIIEIKILLKNSCFKGISYKVHVLSERLHNKSFAYSLNPHAKYFYRSRLDAMLYVLCTAI